MEKDTGLRHARVDPERVFPVPPVGGIMLRDPNHEDTKESSWTGDQRMLLSPIRLWPPVLYGSIPRMRTRWDANR